VRAQRPIEPEPAPGVGASVDPLGDGFMLLLPDGFRLLLAPAAEPPALKFGLPAAPVALPVVVPGAGVAVLPTDAGPDVVPAPAEPVPCAIAAPPESIKAAANPIVVSLMVISFWSC
jgi:hypothetical protein